MPAEEEAYDYIDDEDDTLPPPSPVAEKEAELSATEAPVLAEADDAEISDIETGRAPPTEEDDNEYAFVDEDDTLPATSLATEEEAPISEIEPLVETETAEASAEEVIPVVETVLEEEDLPAPVEEIPLPKDDGYVFEEDPLMNAIDPLADEPDLPPEEGELPDESDSIINHDLDTAKEIAESIVHTDIVDQHLLAEDLETVTEKTTEPSLPTDQISETISVDELETVASSSDEDTPALNEMEKEASDEIEDDLPTADADKSKEPEKEVETSEVENSEVETTPIEEAAALTASESDAVSIAESAVLAAAFLFTGTSSDEPSFTGTSEKNVLTLDNEKGQFNDLSKWQLIISEFSVTEIEIQAGQTLPLAHDIFCQGELISEEGKTLPFVNQTEIQIPADFAGETPQKAQLAISGLNVISLGDQNGTEIELENASGMIIGPNGTKLSFSGINKIILPHKLPETSLTSFSEEKIPESTDVFVFTANDASTAANKTTEAKNIVIKTGYSLYGWNVVFSSGLNMSLSDLRSFQSKHKKLPEASGIISYKDARLTFTNAESIKAYEKPSYCGYGQPAALG